MRHILILICAIAAISVRAAEPVRLVVSVADVREEGPPFKPGVYIDFVVHAPAEFRGLPLTAFAGTALRRSMRAKFPLGELFGLQVPVAIIEALQITKRQQADVQGEIDAGVRRDMISQIVMPPQIVLSELVTQPSAVEVR